MYLNKKQKKAILIAIDALNMGCVNGIQGDESGFAYDILFEMLEKSNRTHKNDKRQLRQAHELEEYERGGDWILTHSEICRSIADLTYEQSVKNNTVYEPTDCPYYNAGKTVGDGEKGNEETDKSV